MEAKNINVTYGLLLTMLLNILNILIPMFLLIGNREHFVVNFMFNGVQIFVYWAVFAYLIGKLYDYLSSQKWYKKSFLAKEIGRRSEIRVDL